jgi:hypothetical protein
MQSSMQVVFIIGLLGFSSYLFQKDAETLVIGSRA